MFHYLRPQPILAPSGHTQNRINTKSSNRIYSPIGPPHARVSDKGPEHLVPQAFPGVHVRLRDCVPAPHDVEQALHAPKAPITALTRKNDDNVCGNLDDIWHQYQNYCKVEAGKCQIQHLYLYWIIQHKKNIYLKGLCVISMPDITCLW